MSTSACSPTRRTCSWRPPSRRTSTPSSWTAAFSSAAASSRPSTPDRSSAKRPPRSPPCASAATGGERAPRHVALAKGEQQRAVDLVRDALARYGDTARGDDLRRTLAHFERERADRPEAT